MKNKLIEICKKAKKASNQIIEKKLKFHESKNKSLVWYRLDSLDKRDLTGSIKYFASSEVRSANDRGSL